MKYQLLILAGLTVICSMKAYEQERKIKHAAEWEQLILELAKNDCPGMDLPNSSSDSSALQARGLAKILEILQLIKEFMTGGGSASHQKILDLLKDVQKEVVAIREVLGSLDDESVEDLPSPQAIDQAQLSLVSWLKSIYRFQLEHTVIS